MVTNGLLIVISGPSGAGKGTVCKEAKNALNLELSVSATTRKPRIGEVDGINYFFKQKDEFIQMIEKDEFIEYAQVYDNYYGTPKQIVLDKMKEGKDIILEIDVQGAMQVKKNYPEAVFIFIMPPSFDELKKRIVYRGTETPQDIAKRMHNAYKEICNASQYDYVVINDDIKSACGKIASIITAERCRLKRCQINFDEYKEE